MRSLPRGPCHLVGFHPIFRSQASVHRGKDLPSESWPDSPRDRSGVKPGLSRRPCLAPLVHLGAALKGWGDQAPESEEAYSRGLVCKEGVKHSALEALDKTRRL